MNRRVTESDLERIRETLKLDTDDPLAAQQWISRARQDLEALVEDLTDRHTAVGGEFAEMLRSVLEDRILEKVGGRVQLTARTRELSLGVHVLPTQVIVDVRLEIGVGK